MAKYRRKINFRNAVFLCGLEIWQSFPHLSPIHVLRSEIKAMIEVFYSWLIVKLHIYKFNLKKIVFQFPFRQKQIFDITLQADVEKWLEQCDADLTLAVLSFNGAMNQFSKDYIVYFNRFDISYCEIVFSTADSKVTHNII